MFRKLFLLFALGASSYYFAHKPVQEKIETEEDIFASMYLDCRN